MANPFAKLIASLTGSRLTRSTSTGSLKPIGDGALVSSSTPLISSSKTLKELVEAYLKEPDTVYLLQQALEEAHPRPKARENPAFGRRAAIVAGKTFGLAGSYAAAGIFYSAAATKWVAMLVAQEVIKAANAYYWEQAYKTGTVSVNGPFILSGGVTTLGFIWKHTWDDALKIYQGKLPPAYLAASIAGLVVCGGVAYLGTYGPYDIAREDFPNDPFLELFCNVANTIGNSAGGAGVANVIVFNWVNRLLRAKPDRSLVTYRKQLTYGSINVEDKSKAEDEMDVEKGQPSEGVVRESLVSDLNWLVSALRNIKQADAKALFNNVSFRALLDQISSPALRNNPDEFLKVALLCAVLLTENQEPRSTFDTTMKATLISAACAPSQIGLIAAGLNYINRMGLTRVLELLVKSGAIVAPLSMVSVFGWNFTKQSQNLNALDLSGFVGLVFSYLAFLIPFFLLCCFSYSATAGTTLEHIGMYLVIVVALSTVMANFVPGRVEVRDYFQELALLAGSAKVSKAMSFIHQIQAITALLENLASKVESGEMTLADCEKLSQQIAQNYFHMKGADFSPAPAAPAATPAEHASSSEEIVAEKPAQALILTTYIEWVTRGRESKAGSDRVKSGKFAGFVERLTLTPEPARLTAQQFLDRPETQKFCPPPQAAGMKKSV